MAQTVVPKFYTTRKKFRDPVKKAIGNEKEELLEIRKDCNSTVLPEKPDVKKTAQSIKAGVVVESKAKIKKSQKIESVVKTESKTQKSVKAKKNETKSKTENLVKSEKKEIKIEESVGENINLGKSVNRPKQAKGKSKKVNKITKYLKSETESEKANNNKNASEEEKEAPHTPKRNLSASGEVMPSKKKPRVVTENATVHESSPSKMRLLTPIKQDAIISKQLHFGSPNRFGSPKKFGSPVKNDLTPQKAALYENLTDKDLVSDINSVIFVKFISFCSK